MIKRLILFSLLLLGSTSFFCFNHPASQTIPVSFDLLNLPVINIQIEEDSYSLVLDLGAGNHMSLDDEILQKIQKRPYGVVRFKDLKGNNYKSENYLIPQIKIGNVRFAEVLAQSENDAFNHNTILRRGQHLSSQMGSIGRALPSGQPPHQKMGSIGRPLLKRYNLLLDFPHSSIALVERPTKKAAQFTQQMHVVPFEMTPSGITIKITTDLGEKKFLIDTGTSWNLVRSSLYDLEKDHKNSSNLDYFSTPFFEIEGKNFGPTTLHLLDISPDIEDFDGILGMTFLRRHTVYIDFPKRLLHISE